MKDLNQLQIIGQLLDNIEITLKEMEKAYEKKDPEAFFEGKKEVLNIKQKIDEVLK